MIVVTTTVVITKHMKQKNQIKQLLKYVILAPSGYNSQPWKFKLGDNSLEIIPDYTRARLNTDPDYREFFMSLGAAAFNLEVAAKHFGMDYKKTYHIDESSKNSSIYFEFTGQKLPPEKSSLFSAISTRHTNRFAYQNKNIPKNLVAELKALPHPENIELNLVTRPGDKTTLANLIHQSYLLWYKNQILVEELESWLRDDLSVSKDGLPTGVLNLYKLAISTKYILMKEDLTVQKRSEHDQNLAKSAPALVILSSKIDNIKNWFQTGEFFELLVLTLASYGYSSDFFTPPLTMKKSRSDTARIVESNYLPQLLFRIGIPTVKTPKTPRRPLREMLIS